MTIAFNQDQLLRGMFFYDASAGTYADRNLTTGDYFDNNSDVGDCLYFSVGGAAPTIEGPYQGLLFYVGTALSAAAITLVWEYQNHGASTWAALPGVTDNTNNFTTTGANYVTWTIPTNWGRAVNIFGNYDFSGTRRGLLVRCRITAVTSITEGGANSTVAMKYKDYQITATNEASLTMASLLSADTTGGWGVITQTINNTDYDVYRIACNLYLAGTTSFTSSRQIILMGDDSYRWSLSSASGSTFQLGLLDSTGYGWKGSTFIYYSKDAYSNAASLLGSTKIYGSAVHKVGSSYYSFTLQGVVDIRDSLLDTEYFYWFHGGSSGNLYRTVLTGIAYYMYSATLVMQGVGIMSSGANMYCAGGAVVSESVLNTSMNIYRYAAGSIALKNCSNFDRAKLLSNSPSGSVDLYTRENYTLDLLVLDQDKNPIVGATVRVNDVDGTETLKVTTDANGVIAQQTITAYHAKWAYPDWGNSTKDFNPFTVTVYATGYETYKVKFSLLKKENLTIRLRQSASVGRDDMGTEFN